MKNSELIGVEVLRRFLAYEPTTGLITWKASGNGIVAGMEFGSKVLHGKNLYITGRLTGRKLRAHRVAWALHFGSWPNGILDHINHDGCDNRICNLRIVSPIDNSRNAKLRCDSSTGVTGVSWHSSAKKWRAHISVKGKQVSLGVFDNKEDAIRARVAASVDFGFHENHGMLVSQ